MPGDFCWLIYPGSQESPEQWPCPSAIKCSSQFDVIGGYAEAAFSSILQANLRLVTKLVHQHLLVNPLVHSPSSPSQQKQEITASLLRSER